MYNYYADVKRVAFKDYLPTPLKSMTPLTAKRQLVSDIQSSSKYLEDFPILERLEDFDTLWADFVAKVSSAAPNLPEDQYAEFSSKWSFFYTQISNLKFEADTITTVPKALINLWPIDFSFLDLTYKDKRLLEYFDLILKPSTNTVWQDLFDSTEEVFDKYVTGYIKSLSELREIKHVHYNDQVQTTDTEIINLTAKMLGLNLRDELLDAIGPERLAALIPMLGQFYEINSTEDFVKIIELVISSRVLIEHLYSKDYINFKTKDQVDGPFIYEDSKENLRWFKTTHINLFVEYNGVKYLTDTVTAPLGSSVMDIVKLYMPINLVVKNFGLFLELNTVDTAPSVYFCGTVDSVRGTKTITADERRFAALIPIKS